MAPIRNFMIYTGVLLLVAHYSIGNPVPRHRRSDQNQALETTCPEWTHPDTNSALNSVTQITNGISVYRGITPAGGPVSSEPSLLGVKAYTLGLQTVCRMRSLYLQYNIALINTDESNDNYISYTSAKYVAQHVMENACRWVQIVANSSNASVRNCTLEDIDAACLDFVRYYELLNINIEINNYVKESFPGVSPQAGPSSRQDWFNCNLNRSQECLSTRAVSHIRDKISQ